MTIWHVQITDGLEGLTGSFSSIKKSENWGISSIISLCRFYHFLTKQKSDVLQGSCPHCDISDVIIKTQHSGCRSFLNECDSSWHFALCNLSTAVIHGVVSMPRWEFPWLHGTNFEFHNLYKSTGCCWGYSPVVLGQCFFKAAYFAGWGFPRRWSSTCSLYHWLLASLRTNFNQKLEDCSQYLHIGQTQQHSKGNCVD